MKIKEPIRTIEQTTIPAINPVVLDVAFNPFFDASALVADVTEAFGVSFVTITYTVEGTPAVEILVVCNVNGNLEDDIGTAFGVCSGVGVVEDNVIFVECDVAVVVGSFVVLVDSCEANFTVALDGVESIAILVVRAIVDGIAIKDVDIDDIDTIDMQGFCVGFGLIFETPSENKVVIAVILLTHIILLEENAQNKFSF